jgi:hypothetical protein
MRRNGLLCFAALAASAMGWAQDQVNASISGQVISGLTHLPAQNTSVTVVKTGLPPFSQSVQAGPDGTFQAGSLPPGTYLICARSEGLLDPCQWNLATLVIELAPGGSSKGNTITLKAGSVSKLRVDDLSQLLSANTKDGRTPDLVAGVWSGTLNPDLTQKVALVASKIPLPSFPTQFHSMKMAARDATGANYQLLVPYGTPLNFHIESHDLALADATGLALPSNQVQVAFQQSPSATTAASFHYQIIGRHP